MLKNILFKNSMRAKIAVYFSLLFAVILILSKVLLLWGLPFSSYEGRVHEIKMDAFGRLNQVADIKKNELVERLDEIKSNSKMIARNSLLNGDIMRLCAVSRGLSDRKPGEFRAGLLSDRSFVNIRNYLKNILDVTHFYKELYIADIRTGIVLVSTRDDFIGNNIFKYPHLKRALLSQAGYMHDISADGNNGAVLNIFHLIEDRAGNDIAVLGAMVRADEFLRFIKDPVHDLGESGETLLVNQDNFILAPLRHPLSDGTEARVLSYRPQSNLSEMALRGEEGMIESIDYRGVPVLAAYRHIRLLPEWGWGLIVKRDKQELLRPVREDIRSTVLIAAASIFLVVALTVAISRRLAKPIEDLSDVARKISKGDINARALISSNDEIGYLSITFNKMADQISTWYDELEMLIRKRTSELLTKTHELTNEIIERKKAEDELVESHLRLIAVLDSLDAGVYVADMNTYEILFVNDYLRKIFGDTGEKICYKVFQSDRDTPCEFCTNARLIGADGRAAGVVVWEYCNPVANKWFELRDRAIRWIDGRMVRIEIATDITDRKRTEEQIKTSLREKEVLLKEIHHRVKNNLQIIVSIVNLQSRKVRNKKSAEVFKEIKNRIRAISLTHEKLYMAENIEAIKFSNYAKSIAAELCRSYGINAHKVGMVFEIEDIEFGVDTAIPCGLVISELVSNSLKHAFPKNRRGEIKVSLHEVRYADIPGNRKFELFVSDNGIGIPDTFDIKNTETLGLQLVDILVEDQLHGRISVSRNNGTSFNIIFEEIRQESRV